MKKFLSLLLVLLMLLTVLVSCNNTTPSTDTDSQTTDTATDTEKNDENIDEPKDTDTPTPSFNSFNFTSEREYRYYEKAGAGNYLGTDIDKNSIDSKYRIIRTYDEFSRLVEYPTSVPAKVFEDNFILMIRTLGSSSHRIASGGGFYDLSYDSSLKLLSISVHTRDDSEFGTCDEVKYYDYLIIPKNTVYSEPQSVGDIVFYSENIVNNEYSYETFYNVDETKIKLGESYISSDLSKIDEILNNCLTKEIHLIKDSDTEKSVFILICEKACYCSLGYRDFHFDGETAFLTYGSFEHKDTCDSAKLCLTLLSVKMDNASEKITDSTKVKLLCEKRVHKEITDYLISGQSNIKTTTVNVQNDYYISLVSYESKNEKIDFPKEKGRYFKIINSYEELQKYIDASKLTEKSFNSFYVLALNFHEDITYYGEKIIGFRNFVCEDGKFKINMDYYQSNENLVFDDAFSEYNLTYYFIIPKEKIEYVEGIHEIEWIINERDTVSYGFYTHTDSTPLYDAPTSFIADYDTMKNEYFFKYYFNNPTGNKKYLVLYLPYELKGDFVITKREVKDGDIYLTIENYTHKSNDYLKSNDVKYYAIGTNPTGVKEDYTVYITINKIYAPQS